MRIRGRDAVGNVQEQTATFIMQIFRAVPFGVQDVANARRFLLVHSVTILLVRCFCYAFQRPNLIRSQHELLVAHTWLMEARGYVELTSDHRVDGLQDLLRRAVVLI